MSNYERVKNFFEEYFKSKGVQLDLEISLRDSSYNDNGNNYLYDGKKELVAISMDTIAKYGYKVIKDAKGNPVNTVDAFLVDTNNEWYLIEFKDCQISKKKENIEKKGMGNFLMLMDIFYDGGNFDIGDYDNFLEFARSKITYILVCSKEKDGYSYDQIRASDIVGERYTPEPLMKFKDYFFKDAYAYTEDYFERRFIKEFSY